MVVHRISLRLAYRSDFIDAYPVSIRRKGLYMKKKHLTVAPQLLMAR